MRMYRLNDRETGIKFRIDARDFSGHQSVETAPWSPGAHFPG